MSQRRNHKEIRKYLETNENENKTPKLMGCRKSSNNRKVYSSTILPQETRKISNKQTDLTPKGTRQRKKNKQNPKVVEGKKS